MYFVIRIFFHIYTLACLNKIIKFCLPMIINPKYKPFKIKIILEIKIINIDSWNSVRQFWKKISDDADFIKYIVFSEEFSFLFLETSKLFVIGLTLICMS